MFLSKFFRNLLSPNSGARRRGRGIFRIEPLEDRSLLSTFLVTTNLDSQPGENSIVGSLRWAIERANEPPTDGSTSHDIIFYLQPGRNEIHPNSVLPPVNSPVDVRIDGTLMPGFQGNPLLTLRGSANTTGATDGVDGLTILSPNVTVKSISVVEFTGSGIVVKSSNVRVQGCFVGTTGLGISNQGNRKDGIVVLDATENPGLITIGGREVEDRNVIVGNGGDGIRVENSPNVDIVGNYVGIGATGEVVSGVPLGNALAGVTVSGPTSINVSMSRNTIAGNIGTGIDVDATVQNAFIFNNLIGTNANGTVALGNGNGGITIAGPGTDVAFNVVSGNQQYGIHVLPNTPAVRIRNNVIGTSSDGTFAVSNVGTGVLFEGYEGAVSENTVSGNVADGIRVSGTAGPQNVRSWFTGESFSNAANPENLFFDLGHLPEFALGFAGRGYRFDGVDDYYYSGGGGFSAGLGTEGTIQLRVRWSSMSGEQVLVEELAQSPAGTILGGFSFYKGDDNSLRVLTTGGQVISSGPLTLSTAEFSHVAMVRDGDTVRLYFNGAKVAEAQLTNSASGLVDAQSRIGNRGAPGEKSYNGYIPGGSRYFAGTMDEIVQQTYALTETEIQANANSTSPGLPGVAAGNYIAQNRIGTNAAGTAAVPNGKNGVDLFGDLRYINLSVNTISGNSEAGVRIETLHDENQKLGTLFSGNSIGVDVSGSFPIGNGTGIHAVTGWSYISQGDGFRRDIISGNTLDGIQVEPAALVSGVSTNLYYGLTEPQILIGTDRSGRHAIPNGRHGVNIQFSSNSPNAVLGLALISGNRGDGVHIEGESDGSYSFQLYSSLIGLGSEGATDLGNGGAGIFVRERNRFAGQSSAAVVDQSTVSANDVGIDTEDAGVTITGSNIGTNRLGSFAIPNRIGIRQASGRLLVSGTPTTPTVVSGNAEAGIVVQSSLTPALTELQVFSSQYGGAPDVYVGLDRTGLSSIPNQTGIVLEANDATSPPGINSHFRATVTAVVSGNRDAGIEVRGDDEAPGKIFISNSIIGAGIDRATPVPNGGDGIRVASDTLIVDLYSGYDTGSTYGPNPNLIAFNGGAGLRHHGSNGGQRVFLNAAVNTDSSGNTNLHQLATVFLRNSGMAIDLGPDGPSAPALAGIAGPPDITAANASAGFVTVTGNNSANPLDGQFIQFYSTNPTRSGRGQGSSPLGVVGLLNGSDSQYLKDFDPRNDHFEFRIPVDDSVSAGTLITAVYSIGVVDFVGNVQNFAIRGISEFSEIIPVGSVLSSLAPVVDAGGSVQLFAGDSLTRTVRFRDEDSTAFEVLVDYGDGSRPKSLDYRRDNRTMLLDHVYRKAGSYTVTVSVLDDSMPVGRLGTDSFQVVVQNTPPEIAFNDVLLTKRIREGETVDLAGTFADLGAEDAHTIEVDWGDGTAVTPAPIASGARSFALNHRYDDDGVSRADAYVYRVVVTLRDEFGAASATPVFLVEVDNVVPSVLQLALDQTTIDEGGVVTLSGSFADPGLLDTHLVYVNWGDGSAKEKVPLDQIIRTGSLREFSLGHTYLDNPSDGASYTITVEVADDDDPLNPVSSTLQIAVSNQLPFFNETGVGQPPIVLGDDVIDEGSSVAAFAYFLDQGMERHTARVNWGDGTPETVLELPASGSPSFLPFLNHRYDMDGIFEITITVSDRDTPQGSEAVTSKLITVRNVAPTVLPISVSPTGSVREGDEVSVSGFFTDPAVGETYSVIVNWGDGSTSPAEVNRTTRSYSATHRYQDDPTATNDQYSITVVVNDGVQTGTRTVSKVVQNVAPVLSVLPVIDTSTNNPVFRAVAQDAGIQDQASLVYSWTLTKNGLSVPFVSRSPTEIELDPAMIPAGSAPLILTTTVDDGDGGVTPSTSALILGTNQVDLLTINNGTFPTGITSLIVLGLGGNDTLDASGITATGLHVTLFGGEGDDLLFDGAGEDLSVLGWGNDSLNLPKNHPLNTLAIEPNMVGNDVAMPDPNSTLTAYDSIGQNTLNFSLAGSAITQANGITFDLELTQRSTIVAQDVAPTSTQPNQHFVAALGTFTKLVGSNYADKLTGASNSSVFGGLGADNFYTKDDITDATFSGGDDADVLTARGVRVSRISFKGDEGADQLRVDDLAEVLDNLDFDGGSDADVLINRGRVSRIVFNGGADADVLQNQKGRISKISFKGDDGIDHLINDDDASIEWQTGDDPLLQGDQGIDFDGGSDADVLINRGRVSRIVFNGGADADVLQNQKGRISKISFKGDDGIDQLINEDDASIEWQSGDDPDLQAEQGIDFDGGSDADILINRGRVSRVVFSGGADADVLQNQRGRISKVSFKGDDGDDRFVNEEFAAIEWQTGDDPTLQAEQGIDFDGGNDADVLINRGRVSRVVFSGGADADVLQNQRGRISKVSFKGDDGGDTFVNEEEARVEWLTGDDPTLQAEQGIDFDGGNDADVLINRGRVSRVVFSGGADADVLQNQRGRVTKISFKGDDGADRFINEEFAAIEWQIGDDPDLQTEQGIDFDGGSDADVLINRGRVSRVVFTGGADADVLQNQKGRVTKISFKGDDGADTLINETNAAVGWEAGDNPSLLAGQGIDFDGGNDADVLINRGRVSRVVFSGGADTDLMDLQAGEVTLDVWFQGGDDADVLIARSKVARIRFDGDAGDDEFLITGTISGDTPNSGVVEFNGGNDADLLVSRGTLMRLVFRGGADDNADDVLQTSGGSIEALEFINDSGVGILVNRTNNIGSVIFTGGNEADMFISRGRDMGNLTFVGGGGDDVFVNSGSTRAFSPGTLTFNAGDGSNAMRNEGADWAQVIYTGGQGEDFLQNNATGIGLLNYTGGQGSNALENNASGISNIVVQGSNDNDIFANDGDNVSGIVFNALNGSNTLINTGANVSGIEYNGGSGNDRLINNGFGLKDATFYGEAGEDRFFNFGANTQTVKMIGGAGADWWINQVSAVGGSQLTLEAGTTDDAADVFINWAANVSNVIVEGGAGDDLLQNGGLNSSNFQFNGGNGNDLLLNLGFGANQFTFDAGDGDDVFENRGSNGGTLRMLGGIGDDAFYQNAGFATDIELEGGDGDDTVLNFSSNMGRVALIGGRGTDILQNSGTDIGSLEVTGGDGKNTLQNFGNRIGSVKMKGSGSFAGAFDTLLNSGNTIGLIDVTSNVTTTVISSGNDISSFSVIGSAFNDVVRITGRNIQTLIIHGNGGDDSLLVDMQSNVGSSITYFGGVGDDLLILRGATDGLFFDGGEDDDQSVVSGSFNNGMLTGGNGDDLYRFVGTPNGSVTIDEVFTGTSTVSDLSRDVLDFSSFTSGPIAIDLAITTPQPQPTLALPLILTLTSGMGIENVVGTSGADTILGNARNNMLSGAQFLAPGSSAPGIPVARTKTQWVYLNFFTNAMGESNNDPGEHVYSEAEALEVKHRMELAYAGFDVRFVRDTSDLPDDIEGDPSKYVTIFFNQTPSSGRPGGESSAIDFGNVDPGGSATVQINGLLGGREVLDSGLLAVAAESADRDSIQAPDIAKPESKVENFIALSSKIATHELAHLLGVRHHDAFGPVGFGINAPPGSDRFKPTFAGVAAAFETADHIISSPASAGTDRFNDLRQLYFGERETIKLALAFSDQSQVRMTESTGAHSTQATAAPLNLVTLDVPNLATGGFSEDKSFNVQATTVVGSIGLASNGKSENDWYSFVGNTGDIVTIEVMSRALERYYETNSTSIDSVVRLYNAAGQLVQTFGADAVNDDEFESSDSLLMDVTLPAGGMYFIEVDTFRRLPGDASYEAAVALRASLEARRNDKNPDNDLSPEEQQLLERLADSLDDTDTGSYELVMYRSTSANATDGIDTINGRAGVDQFNGGPGDDYTLSVSATGAASSNEASVWSGNYVITDRGGDAWTAVVNYGDGSAPITMSPSSASIGTSIPLSHVYADNGHFVVSVMITNDDGQMHTHTLAVDVNNVDPTASLNGPTTGITGTPAVFTVTASDVAGVADPLTYAWTITRNGAAFATQSGGTSYSLIATLPGTYTVSVTVNDGDGGVLVRSRAITLTGGVLSFDVASGMTQRSWVNGLDVVFASDQMAADLLSNPSRVKLTKFSLDGPNADGSGGTLVNFGGASGLSRTGAALKLNFGDKVIGSAGRNSTAADGYYRLELDFDGDGTADDFKYFYRLLGDVNGDRKVDALDANLILAGTTRPYNRELDINGDGLVNGTDRTWTQRSNGRKLKDGLFVND